jgi:hypothetical protein
MLISLHSRWSAIGAPALFAGFLAFSATVASAARAEVLQFHSSLHQHEGNRSVHIAAAFAKANPGSRLRLRESICPGATNMVTGGAGDGESLPVLLPLATSCTAYFAVPSNSNTKLRHFATHVSVPFRFGTHQSPRPTREKRLK